MGMLATQQLTEFLSAVADRPDGPAAQYAAVECAARALEADVAVLIIDSGVVASVGLRAEQVPLTAFHQAAADRSETIELGGERYAITYAPITGPATGLLILGRRQSSF